MEQAKEGDIVIDKLTNKKYIVLKTKDANPERTTALSKIGGLFADPLKEDLFCKRMDDGVTGWKYSAEIRITKK